MKNKRPPRDQRYRDKCFPGAAKEVFSPDQGGFAPLPYVSRELLRHLKGAELKVWVYMLTRGGPQSICYPKLDVEEAMLAVVEQRSYLPEMVGTVCNFGGPESGRSVVKSAFALAVASGVAAQACDQARSYLKSETGEPCFGYYYERDLVTNRPIDRVFHCVAVKGDPEAGRLFGYVELFSAYRMLVGLADRYRGAPLFNSYAIDPCNGEELKLEFNLSLPDDELLRGISNEYECSAAMVAAFQSVAAIAQARSFAREQRRVAKAAWAGALAKLGLSPGQRMTPEIAMALAREIVSGMQPFLSHVVTTNRPRSIATETPSGNRP